MNSLDHFIRQSFVHVRVLNHKEDVVMGTLITKAVAGSLYQAILQNAILASNKGKDLLEKQGIKYSMKESYESLNT